MAVQCMLNACSVPESLSYLRFQALTQKVYKVWILYVLSNWLHQACTIEAVLGQGQSQLEGHLEAADFFKNCRRCKQ